MFRQTEENPSGRKWAKRFFKLLVAFLWLWVCSLCIKSLHTFYVNAYIVNRNPYILASLEGKTPADDRQDVMPKVPIPPSPAKWTSLEGNDIPDWYVAQKDEAPEAADARRTRFLTLNEDDRIRFAICNGETVLRFARDGSLLNVYGDWYKRRKILADDRSFFTVRDLRSALKKAAPRGKAVHETVSVSLNRSTARPVDFFFLPAAQSGEIYVFAKLEYEFLLVRSASIPAESRWEIDGLRYKREQSMKTEGILCETNRYGFRAPNPVVPKPAGVFRVLCIGGSATFEGYDNKHTYPAFLEEHLRNLFPGRQIEVLNCGIEGIRTSSQFLLLPDYMELEPDLIVACEGTVDAGNEIQQECRGYKQAPWLFRFFALEDSSVQRMLWPPEQVLRTWLREATIVDLECLNRALAKRGIRLALASNMYPACDNLPPMASQYYDWKSGYTARLYGRIVELQNDEIKQFCERNGLAYIPLAENMTNSIDYLYDLCHMNWPGSNAKAFIIAQALRDYLSPVLSQPRTL